MDNAPQGGIVSKHMYLEIEEAIKNGINIISGMHQFLSEDKYLKDLAMSMAQALLIYENRLIHQIFQKGLGLIEIRLLH